jgi:tetratricopeptide (TPR) repeat protein
LAGAVYVAGLHGSLQLELLGATRRNGRIPYVLEPQSAALFAELAAGRPVLVLQNLGLVRVPVWHYAVLVGADRAADRVILRSGAERRRLERTARFLRSWEKGESWAFVALRPGELPATATPDRYIRSLAGAEALLTPDATGAAYRTALAEWPDDPLVLFSAATRRQVEHDLEAAIALYRRLLAFAPEHAAARNNLANALAEQGCYAAALTEARTALASIDPDDGLYAAISATVAEVAAAQDTHASAECAAL